MRANLHLFRGGVIACLLFLFTSLAAAQPVFQPPVSAGSSGNSVHPTFNWNNPGGYTDFQLMIFDGASVIYNSGSLGLALTHTPAAYGTNAPNYNNLGANLQNGHFYSMLLYYNDGVMWQSTGSVFQTTSLTTPVANAAPAVSHNGFTAQWLLVAGATGYRLDVSTASDFSGFVPGYNNLDVGNVLTYSVSGLSSNSYYYYRVRAYNPGETSASSNTITVLTYPGMPGLTSPADNAFGVPLSVNLTWAALPAPVDVYYIQVDDNSDFSSPLFEGNIGGVTSYHPAGLVNNVKYYWRVQAHNSSNYGPYCAARSFTTALVTPSGLTVTPFGPPVPSRTPALSWNSAAGADRYIVRLKDAGGTAFETVTIAGTSYTSATSLTPGAAYRFDVQAQNTVSTNFSAVSSEFTFTILPLPTVPVLLSPADNAHGIPLNQAFTWNPSSNGTITYTFGVSIDNTSWTTTSGIAGTSYTPAPGVLAYETEYVWRVSAQNEVGSSAYAAIRHIFTQLKPPTLTYPADNSIGHPLQPRLTWVQPAHGPNHGVISNYEIQYAESLSDLTAGVGTFHTITINNQLSYDFTSMLENNTRYYWRVRAIEYLAASYYPGAWSSVFNFKTVAAGISGLQIPSLFNPIAGVTVFSLTPTLSWGTYQEGITSYELQYVSGDSAALSLVTPIPVAIIPSFTTYVLPTLTAGNSYKWRVRSYNSSTGIYSSWSVIGNFSIDINQGPTTPYPSYPVEQVVYTNYPTFYWYTLSAAAGIQYDVELVRLTPSVVTIPLINNTNLSGLSYLLDVNEAAHDDSLLKAGNYQWRVTAHKPGYSFTSVWAPFTISGIAANIPVKPIISWPGDGALLYSLVPVLNWFTGAANINNIVFDWEISTSPAVNGSGAFTSTADMGTSVTAPVTSGVGPLNNATVYYWHVRARNSVTSVVSEWSDTESFQTTAGTGGVPGQPSLVYPAGGIIISNLTPTFGWQAPAPAGTITNYRVEISSENHPDFVTYRFIDTGLPTGNSYNIPPGVLINGVTYYWRVSASYAGPAGPWGMPSAIGSFTTMAGSAPVVPVAANPVYGSVFKAENPSLSWYLPTQGIDLTYELQYAPNRDFTGAVTIEGLDKPSYDLSNLAAGKYFWRVRTKNANSEYSYYSGKNEFRIGDAVTDVKSTSSIIPDKFEVAQNYPNPFNPSTTIQVSVPEAGTVSIRLYDMLGREIITLFNEDLQAGTYKFDWNGENKYGTRVASGTYIYRVTCAGNVKTMKMVLMK